VELRHPGWAANVSVFVNGKRQNVASAPESYLTLERTWHDGDEIEYRMPLTLHVEPLPGDPTTVSLLYGPVVLAGDMGTDGLPANGQQAKQPGDLNKVPDPPAPMFACATGEILSHVQHTPGKGLTFMTHGLVKPADLPLIPFYQVHHDRYTVYWQVTGAAPPGTAGL
jgi:DUF1680 family protein